MKLKPRLLWFQGSETHHVVKVWSVFSVLARVKAHFCVAGLCFWDLEKDPWSKSINCRSALCFPWFNVPLRMNKVPSAAFTPWPTHSLSSSATLLRDNVHTVHWLTKRSHLRRMDKTRPFLFWLVQKEEFQIEAALVSRSRAAEDLWLDQCAASAPSHAGQLRLEHLSATCHVPNGCQRRSNHTLFYSPHFSWFESIEGWWYGGGGGSVASPAKRSRLYFSRLDWIKPPLSSNTGSTARQPPFQERKWSGRERERGLAAILWVPFHDCRLNCCTLTFLTAFIEFSIAHQGLARFNSPYFINRK